MAKTKAGKKIVHVSSHTRREGKINVRQHYRSTPNRRFGVFGGKTDFEVDSMKPNIMGRILSLFRKK